MAYLNFNKLAEGRIFKGMVYNDEVIDRYIKLVDGELHVSLSGKDGTFVKVHCLADYSGCDNWEEVEMTVKYVPALTELAKSLLDIKGSRLAVRFSTRECGQQFLEALENSTEFKWKSGAKPTNECSFRRFNDCIFLYNDEKEITWDNLSNFTANVKNVPSIYVDYDLMATELVELIEIKEEN